MLRSFNQAYLGVITPIYLLTRGATAAEVGVLVTVWASGSALLGLGAGFVSDRFGRKLVLAIFSTLSAFAALAFYFDMPLWVLGVAGALGTIGRGGGPASGGAFGPFYSAEQALVAEHVDQQMRTRAFAAFCSHTSTGIASCTSSRARLRCFFCFQSCRSARVRSIHRAKHALRRHRCPSKRATWSRVL
jgi:MFS family permease